MPIEMPTDPSEMSTNSSSHMEDGSGTYGDGGASSGTTSVRSGSGSHDDQDKLYFAARENAHVRKLKLLMFLIFFLVTVAVCLAVYFLTANGQQDEFEAAFVGLSSKVMQSFEDIMQQKIAAIASLGVTFTAFALNGNHSWPFVTMNDFQQRSASARSLSGAYFFELLPIVSDEVRDDWEEYSVENKEWLNEGRAYQAKNSLGAKSRELQLADGDSVTGDVVLTFTPGESSISERIFTFDESWNVVVDPGPGPYYPIWQSSPVLPEPRDLVNYNVLYYPQYGKFIDVSASTGQITIGGLDTAPPGDITHPELSTSFFAYLASFAAGKYVNYTGEPYSSVYVPVVDTFEDDRKTVAIILAVINWSTYFENILDSTADPVHVVLENTCDGPYTYEITGPEVTFMGQGNLANNKYEDMKISVELDSSNFIAEETTIALTLNQELCQYSLSVYPTVTMEQSHNDFFPIAIACTIAAVFAFAVLVFIFYDMMVEKRQKKILETAKKSTAIVSSIFPKKVRDQLLGAPVQGNATKLRRLAGGATPMGQSTKKLDGSSRHSDTEDMGSPIADLFPECTV
ncbi:MAG: hypothetical protein SGARI_002839, partial [Bacillariaceae sp.]